ncbi:MAG: alcohol dehydrogenase catalytic domain-containing protein, partial [Candidatus Hydrothermarchaeales archaeon]
MKAAVYYNNRDVRIEEVPRPEIHDGELLVKVMASGICGSDVMEWYRIKKAPLVLGHEITGVVEKVGEGIVDFHKGDRVVVTHHVPCDTCKYCQSGKGTMCETLRTTNFYPGGFAEYVRVPKINVEKGTLHLPDEISFEEGTFIEPLGCVVRGQRTVGIEEGQTVLVLGSGISGLLHVQLAKVRGAKKVIATDVSQNRLNAAMAFGADVVIDAMDDVPSRVIMENDGKPADRVIV